MPPSILHFHILSGIISRQWLAADSAIRDYACAAMGISSRAEAPGADALWEQFYTLRRDAYIDADGICHIQINGTLSDDAPSIYEKLSISTRYGTIISETAAAVDQGAKGILYHINSPGGAVTGVIEAGQAIGSAPIPTAAYCSGLTCSGGYWLAAACDGIIASPSAQVGSIGAICGWTDDHDFWESMGVKFKALVSQGADLKSTFALEPDETQLAFLQESLDQVGQSFRDHVTTSRAAAGADLDDEVWRAGWYSGDRAWSLGLIDAIGTAEDALTFLIGKINP